jgi:hypothetical protein
MTRDQALHAAFVQRADFQSAKALMRSAEESLGAELAERDPSMEVTADHGATGLPSIMRMAPTPSRPQSDSIRVYPIGSTYQEDRGPGLLSVGGGWPAPRFKMS